MWHLDRRTFLLRTSGGAIAAAGLSRPVCRADAPSRATEDAEATRIGSLAEFLEYRPLRPLPSTQSEWEQEFGVQGSRLRNRIRKSFGLHLLADELARPVEVRERGEPLVPDGWHYRIRRLVLTGVYGTELPANVYEPTRPGPHAGGFVYVTGHIDPSKEWPEGQQLCANLAERGIVAVSLDYFGLGERRQPGNAHNVGTCSYTGLTAIGMELSDGMTAVSYLLQRNDVDARNIGFTGWSGGGHFTQWMGVVDPRITLVVPCVGTCDYLWMWLRPASSGRNECWHMHPPGFMAYADMGLAFATVAPRRLRIIDEDNVGGAFSCEQAVPLVERAAHAYRLYGVPDKCDLRCPDPIHDYSPIKQRVLYEVVNEAFFGGTSELGTRVLDTPQYPPETLRVGIDGTITRASIYADRIRSLPRPERLAVPSDHADLRHWRDRFRDELAQLLAIDRHTFIAKPVQARTSKSSDGRTTISRLVPVEKFGDRWLAVRTWELPADSADARTIALIGRPDNPALARLSVSLGRNFRLLFIEPRDDADESNRLQCYGIFYGRPAVGMKVQDVLRALDVLLRDGETAGVIGLSEQKSQWNTGEAGEIALLAATLGSRISSATVRLSFLTWKQQALDDALSTDYASIPGILELGDVPQMIAAALPSRIQLISPEGTSAEKTRTEYAWAEQALARGGSEAKLAIMDEFEAEALVRWHQSG